MDGLILTRLLGSFGVVALLLWAASVVLQNEAWARAGSHRRRLIDPIETTALSSTSAVHVVRMPDGYYVLGSSNGNVSLLRPLDKEDVEAHLRALRARRPFSLRSVLRKLRRKPAKVSLPGRDRTKVR